MKWYAHNESDCVCVCVGVCVCVQPLFQTFALKPGKELLYSPQTLITILFLLHFYVV